MLSSQGCVRLCVVALLQRKGHTDCVRGTGSGQPSCAVSALLLLPASAAVFGGLKGRLCVCCARAMCVASIKALKNRQCVCACLARAVCTRLKLRRQRDTF